MNTQQTDSLIITGALEIILVDANGELKDKREVKNLVLTQGKNYIANRMKTSGQVAEMGWMAIGTNSTAAVVANKNLGGAEAARVALTTSGGTVAANVVTYSATFSPGTGTGAITEAGIFNYATYVADGSQTASQLMLCRTVFGVVTKAAADTLTINWNVTVN